MKKVVIYFILILSVGNLVASWTTIDAVAETIVEENSEEILFEDLSEADQSIFLENGFTGEENYYISTEMQYHTNNDSSEISLNLGIFNVVTTLASTKRVATNRAETLYSIKSSKLPMTVVNVETEARANNGDIVRKSKATKKPGTKTTTLKTTTIYSGRAAYFKFQARSQVTTTAGLVPTVFSVSGGGVTLGY